ncbi:hypothetical protein WJX75_004444 [Coccomyxa subellipsoidea]|uniref:N-terminal nucleophile aminohydrolase n=1 Tax=Coccomyxa subellipsoidea TaxID=248742 RepID=A0ABR2Z3H5_9CHLO
MELNNTQHGIFKSPCHRPFFIAVHVGVGQHSAQKEKAYKTVMRQACRMGAEELQAAGDPLQAVVAAVSSLEDAPLGNAGLNSNLTVKGVVQCDASTMVGDGAFGAVGAVSGVTNPVRIAGELARQSREPMALGRVRPMFLAGDGAREWALEQGLSAAPSPEAASQWHITDAAQRRWQRYQRLIDEASQSQEAPSSAIGAQRLFKPEGEPGTTMTQDASPPAKRLRTDTTGSSRTATAQHQASASCEEDADCLAYDTVGAVCVDALGRVAASVSSGGIAMKTDGRVGEAAMFGSGCWAADAEPSPDRPAVACSVTGVGEAVMRAGLSRACAEALQVDAAAAAAEADARTSTVDAICGREIRDCVELGQPAGLPCPHRDCGVLAVRVSRSSGGAGGSGGVDVAGCGALGGNLGSQERSSSMAATAGAADEGGQ